MRYAWLFISVSWMNPALSQEIKVSVEQGYAIATMPAAKRMMLNRGAGAGMEFRKGERTTISAGFVGYTLQAGYSLDNENRYDKRFFLQLPVAAERLYPFSKHSGGYVQAGVYIARNSLSKIESRLNGTIIHTEEKNAGWNAGVLFCIGFRTVVTHHLSFAIGLRGQRDCWQKYIAPEWKIKTEGTSLVLCFYRKLNP